MFKDITLTVIALIALGLTKLVFNTVVIRSFGADVLGNVNLAISTALFLALFSSTGFGPAATKYISEYLGKNDLESAKKTFTVSFIINLLFSIILFGLMLGGSGIFARKIGGQKELYMWAAPITLFYGMYVFYKSVYYGVNKVKDYFKNELFCAGLFFISLLMIIVFRPTMWLLLPFILSYLIFSLKGTKDLRSYFTWEISFSRKTLKPITSFAAISSIGTYYRKQQLALILLGLINRSDIFCGRSECLIIFLTAGEIFS